MLRFEQKERYGFGDFRAIVELLRSPGGCPWDRAQNHQSIRRNLLEEAYELAHALDSGDRENLREELGDVLMQVLFHARIEEEQGSFDIDDVCDAAVRKLLFRHPHVFGSAEAGSPEQALERWEQAKRTEKRQRTEADALEAVAESLPALWRAEKVQKKSARAGVDRPEIPYALGKLREETEELAEGIAAGDRDNMEEEIGDVLFAAVNTARLLEIDPEAALHRACDKYIRRFRYVEQAAVARGQKLSELDPGEVYRLYQYARRDLEGKEMQAP